MNLAAELVSGLTPAAASDFASRLNTTSETASSSDSTSATSGVTSSHHVDFSVETDDVDVNEKQTKGRFLTAKYPKHQMGLIRRRLNVEDWIDEQLKILFDIVSHSAHGVKGPLSYDKVIDLRRQSKTHVQLSVNH